MKKILVIMSALFVVLLLVGCAVEEKLDVLEDRLEPENAVQRDSAVLASASAELTKEQAQAIALEHAGFSANQVNRLRTEYEIDDGVAQYDVSFHEGAWEYEFEIHAETGRILSFDKDCDND